MSDEAVCIELLPRVSRTFALSIEALPEPLRRAVRAAYLLCRIVDTIEDDPALRAAERARMFDLFQR
ncbi:MAG: squalene/phytoene synthase family protein, partial [Myxococcota bacterium]|nr:squalene/phytoene synthase family protein [Myxococcota bacterium]